MAIPSGSGTEVLKRAVTLSANNTTTSVLTCPADTIITVLNVIFSQDVNATKNFELSISPAGSADLHLLRGVEIPAYGSYAWESKLVLHPADILKVWSNSTDHDVLVNYIQQDWS